MAAATAAAAAPPSPPFPAAPPPEGSSRPGSWPNFAVVCSFLERYGALLDLPELPFPELERVLQAPQEPGDQVPRELVELHLKLMRKIGKSVTADRWEKYLIRVYRFYIPLENIILDDESFTVFNNIPPKVKNVGVDFEVDL
ncbi:PREDICTED: remodeling and spacing factor 1-like [Thamnophis sirtalis]|uniref:Remodeling and spacing factor 1-like n=1 Tax=Thamnophis sirtalis TaxID=35019 RepID=A0A6I9X8F1_9SAUR|nr:PREDICTED: remodeling and spacing factor 1-like [Thamnophis sirtalis]